MTKLARLVLGMAVAAGMLAWQGPAMAADEIISEIKSRGVLRVCHADYPPYNLKDPTTNEWQGINNDLAVNLAETLGVEIEHVDASWGTLVQNLLTDKCDLSVAATYITPQRAEVILYTDTLMHDAVSAFVLSDSSVKTWEDLDQPGKVIGVMAGAFEEPLAKEFFKQAEVKLLVIDKVSSGLLEAANKRVDAYFSSVAAPARFVVENPQLKLRALGDTPLQPTPIAFMVPPGEYQFQQYLNVWLEDMNRSGAIKRISTEWLGDIEQ